MMLNQNIKMYETYLVEVDVIDVNKVMYACVLFLEAQLIIDISLHIVLKYWY